MRILDARLDRHGKTKPQKTLHEAGRSRFTSRCAVHEIYKAGGTGETRRHFRQNVDGRSIAQSCPTRWCMIRPRSKLEQIVTHARRLRKKFLEEPAYGARVVRDIRCVETGGGKRVMRWSFHRAATQRESIWREHYDARGARRILRGNCRSKRASARIRGG